LPKHGVDRYARQPPYLGKTDKAKTQAPCLGSQDLKLVAETLAEHLNTLKYFS